MYPLDHFDLLSFADTFDPTEGYYLFFRTGGRWESHLLGAPLAPDLGASVVSNRLFFVGQFGHVGEHVIVGPGAATRVELWEFEPVEGEDESWIGHDQSSAPSVRIDKATFEPVSVGGSMISTPTEFGLFNSQRIDTIGFPIDVVYTWVDDEDPDWRRERAAYLPKAQTAVDASMERYRSFDELRYSMRSLQMYLPFVNHVFLVTAGHVPSWLDANYSKLTVVTHSEIFLDPSDLPTFNSHSIESQLHRIPGLSEHYLYVNDDVIFGKPQDPRTYFSGNGQSRFFWSTAPVPQWAGSQSPLIDEIALNARDLLIEHFGVRVTNKFRHTAHPQIRSVLEEMEQRFPELWAQVAASRFRARTDVSLAVSLFHHYSFATGRSLPGQLAYDYFSVDHRLDQRLQNFRPNEVDSFCMNDVSDDSELWAKAQRTASRFLDSWYPYASPFERRS